MRKRFTLNRYLHNPSSLNIHNCHKFIGMKVVINPLVPTATYHLPFVFHYVCKCHIHFIVQFQKLIGYWQFLVHDRLLSFSSLGVGVEIFQHSQLIIVELWKIEFSLQRAERLVIPLLNILYFICNQQPILSSIHKFARTSQILISKRRMPDLLPRCIELIPHFQTIFV